MKRSRPKQHKRKLKSGKSIFVNKGVKPKKKRKMHVSKCCGLMFESDGSGGYKCPQCEKSSVGNVYGMSHYVDNKGLGDLIPDKSKSRRYRVSRSEALELELRNRNTDLLRAINSGASGVEMRGYFDKIADLERDLDIERVRERSDSRKRSRRVKGCSFG